MVGHHFFRALYVQQTILYHHQNLAHISAVSHVVDSFPGFTETSNSPNTLSFLNNSFVPKAPGRRRLWGPCEQSGYGWLQKHSKGEVYDSKPCYSHKFPLKTCVLPLGVDTASHCVQTAGWPGGLPPPSPHVSLSLGSCIKTDSLLVSKQVGVKKCPHGRHILGIKADLTCSLEQISLHKLISP